MTNARNAKTSAFIKMQAQKVGGLMNLAKAVGMPYSTFSARMKDCGKFTADELRAIVRVAGMSEDEQQRFYKAVFGR